MMILVAAGILVVSHKSGLAAWSVRLEIAGWLLLVPAVSAYLAMNFTGASTYTSLSGVKKEMHLALPLEIGGAAVGLCLWLASRFIV